MVNPMPESTLTLCQSLLYPPVRDLGFGLWIITICSTYVQYALIVCQMSGRTTFIFMFYVYVQAKGSHIEEVSDEILGKLACVYFTINRALKLK
jgi:hypothetical protein